MAGEGAERSEAGEGATNLPTRMAPTLGRLRGPHPPTRLRRAGPSLSRMAGLAAKGRQRAERSEAGEGATDLPTRIAPLLGRLRGPHPPTRLRRAGPSLSRQAGEGAERSEAGEGTTNLPIRVAPLLTGNPT